MIEVGEYIRTPYCKIEKVERIDKADNEEFADIVITDKSAYAIQWLLNRDVKHSKNIIDLIEEGDYVNGKYVEKIKQYKDGKSILALIGIIDEKDIKTILTKELFEANCYKVKEEIC